MSSTTLTEPTPALQTVSQRRGCNNLSFNNYLRKVLKQVQPECNMGKDSSEQLDALLKTISTRLAREARAIAHSTSRLTIQHEDIEAAVRLIYSGELAKHATDAGTKALERFETADKSVHNKATRSGLSIPPHISEKHLRDQNSTKDKAASRLNVSEKAQIYLAAVTEYTASEFLEAAGNTTRDGKRKNVGTRDIFLSGAADEDLTLLIKRVNFHWIGAGVEPYIHPSFIPTKDKRRKNAKIRKANSTATPTPGAGRKHLPGSRALRNIRKLQKTTGLLMRKEHFKRLVQDQVDTIWTDGDLRYSSNVLAYFQAFIEGFATDLMKDATILMAHAKRETVEPSDVHLAWSFRRPAGVSSNVDLSGADQLAPPGLGRITLRGGVKRKSEPCLQAIREVMTELVHHILVNAKILMSRGNVKTFNLQWLTRSAATLGYNIPVDSFRKRKVVKKINDAATDAGEDFDAPAEEEFSEEELEEEEEEFNSGDEDSQ